MLYVQCCNISVMCFVLKWLTAQAGVAFTTFETTECILLCMCYVRMYVLCMYVCVVYVCVVYVCVVYVCMYVLCMYVCVVYVCMYVCVVYVCVMYVCMYVLCMYVCMYVLCMYVCMCCVCMYVCMYVCVVYVCMCYVCIYVCVVYVCMYVLCMYVCMCCECMYVCMWMYVCVCMYVRFLGQINPAYAVAAHFFEIYFNSIFPSKPKFSKCSLSLRFPHQNSVSNSSSPHTYHIKVFTHKPYCFYSCSRENFWRFKHYEANSRCYITVDELCEERPRDALNIALCYDTVTLCSSP